MENSIYLGLSRQVTLQRNMNIIANNVANMSTPGFRGQNLMFHEFISDPRGNEDPLSFVYDEGQYQLTAPGSVENTGRSLDVALDGPGFFGVQGPAGEIMYTRAGNFSKAADGTLVTQAGFPVAGAGGGNIVIPDGSIEVNIDQTGFVSNQDGQLGQIMVSEFENLQTLDPYGENMYRTTAAPGNPDNTRTMQGQVESSNVKPVVEMTRMIETLRSFQNLQNMMQSENERLRNAIQKLTENS